MTATLFADVSYYQPVVDDDYPFHFLMFRSNDGSFRDPHFDANLKWAVSAIRRGKLIGFGAYFVFEEDVHATIATLKSVIGQKRPWFTRDKFNRMFVSLDLESWGGKISGDHSREVRLAREAVIEVLNQRRLPWNRKRMLPRDRKRVLIYGNQGDLDTLAPQRGDAGIGLANYANNPAYPGKVYHQFAANFETPPFGACDINSADGLTPRQFAVKVGLLPAHHAKRVVKPKVQKHALSRKKVYTVKPGDTMFGIAYAFRVRLAFLVKANPQLKNPGQIEPGQKIFIP